MKNERLITVLAADKTNKAVWLYRAQNLIWIWIGVATLVTAITFFIDPTSVAHQSAIGRVLRSHLDYVWNVMWAMGGGFLIYGIWRFQVRAEIIGHIFLSSAVIINDITLWVKVPSSPNSFLYLFLAVASLSRIAYLWYMANDRDSL